MTRREARELAFVLLFEKNFTDESVEQILQNAGEARGVEPDEFAMRLARGAEGRLGELDALIDRYAHKWSQKQLSRVALTLMRLAVYEMQYEEEIPVSVAINEAVELAKKYGGEEEAAFINGVLGGIARGADEATV
ncbi:MAG: transcription antitermination factor NusB [Acutalibacteraceae bacterium]|jgi:N utilization substance protein B